MYIATAQPEPEGTSLKHRKSKKWLYEKLSPTIPWDPFSMTSCRFRHDFETSFWWHTSNQEGTVYMGLPTPYYPQKQQKPWLFLSPRRAPKPCTTWMCLETLKLAELGNMLPRKVAIMMAICWCFTLVATRTMTGGKIPKRR